MEKNKEKPNILKYSKIREIIRNNGLKISHDSLEEIEIYADKFTNQLIKNLSYNLKIEGRKAIKPFDVKKAFDLLKKEENFYEI